MKNICHQPNKCIDLCFYLIQLSHIKIHFFNKYVDVFLQLPQVLFANSVDSVSATTQEDKGCTSSPSSSYQRCCRISYSIDNTVNSFTFFENQNFIFRFLFKTQIHMGEGKYSSPREALKSQQSFIEEYSLVLFMNFYGLLNCNMLKISIVSQQSQYTFLTQGNMRIYSFYVFYYRAENCILLLNF